MTIIKLLLSFTKQYLLKDDSIKSPICTIKEKENGG